MPFEIDVAEFLDTEDGFASEGIYTRSIYPHPSSKSKVVNGVFRKSYSETLEQENASTIFTCDSNDVPLVAHGDFLKVNDAEYTVVNQQIIMNGLMIRLYLESAE